MELLLSKLSWLAGVISIFILCLSFICLFAGFNTWSDAKRTEYFTSFVSGVLRATFFAIIWWVLK